jgi:hypothetical protein
MVQLLQSHPAPPTEGRTDMNGLGTRLRSSHSLQPSSHDLYDIAYLAGGHVRAADTAVVALIERGQVRVTPDGQLTVLRLCRRHPVEAAALDGIGTRGWRSVASVRSRFETDPRLSGIAERLAHDGLLRPAILPIPWRRRRLVRRTRAGRQLLHRLRTQPPTDAVPDGTSALLVALHGPDHMSNPQRRAEVFGPPSPTAQTTEPHLTGRPYAPWSRDGLLGYGICDNRFWYGGR